MKKHLFVKLIQCQVEMDAIQPVVVVIIEIIVDVKAAVQENIAVNGAGKGTNADTVRVVAVVHIGQFIKNLNLNCNAEIKKG